MAAPSWPERDGASAPTAAQRLRADRGASITGTTRLIGVIAHPVGHVRAPELFNAYLIERGLDAVLVPLDISPADLPRALDGLRHCRNLLGLLVTVPHKEASVPYLDGLTETAALVGAVNIVRCSPDGTLTGEQLDGQGFVRALQRRGRDPRGARVFMAGAGGVAAGIGFALAGSGASALTFYNRTTARAESLARRIRATYPSCNIRVGTADPAGHEIVINATSAGLGPHDPLPLNVDGLNSSMLVAEVVMVPRETPLLKEAATRGCQMLYGESMALEQLPLMLDFLAQEGRIEAHKDGAA